MGSKISQLFVILFFIAYSLGFEAVHQNFNSDIRTRPIVVNDTEESTPLFLTPLIENGRISEARRRARVQHSKMKDIESYSGFFTVNREYNSNLFFWYFPSKGNSSTDPLILWLQGGPGATSLHGLLNETGPFSVTENNTLKMRNITWINNHNILYIDNPVGTGFSFTEDDRGYATTIGDVAYNLYIALHQFFELFPELRKNEFYVMSKSYGGKYVPALAYVIDKTNENDDIKNKINLVGLAIGNGWIDPINQLQYADYLYQIGLIDKKGHGEIERLEGRIKDLINEENYTEAYNIYYSLIGVNDNNPGLFRQLTGFDHYFNYLQYNRPESLVPISDWVQQSSIRQALHVGNREYIPMSDIVHYALVNDRMDSIAIVLSELLEKYNVLIYYGQLDIICAYPMGQNFLQKLNWSGIEEYKIAPRSLWFVENELAGYTKSVKNLTEVLVRNAGHMVPVDQPLWAWTMISHFTHHEPL